MNEIVTLLVILIETTVITAGFDPPVDLTPPCAFFLMRDFNTGAQASLVRVLSWQVSFCTGVRAKERDFGDNFIQRTISLFHN